jgi:hypothetical protein
MAMRAKALFVAVPQIERNWTAHPSGPSSNLFGIGATEIGAPEDQQE